MNAAQWGNTEAVTGVRSAVRRSVKSLTIRRFQAPPCVPCCINYNQFNVLLINPL
jgi:hypothetical protein